MVVFGYDSKSRGCYHQMMIGTMASRGAYMTLPGGTIPAAGGGGTPPPYFVVGVSFTTKEKYYLVQCFQDRTFTYAFGRDPAQSMISVSGVAFLISAGGRGISSAMPKLLRTYEKSRLANSLSYGSVSIGGATLQGFVVGFSTTTVNPEINLQGFEVQLLAIDPTGSGGGGGIKTLKGSDQTKLEGQGWNGQLGAGTSLGAGATRLEGQGWNGQL